MMIAGNNFIDESRLSIDTYNDADRHGGFAFGTWERLPHYVFEGIVSSDDEKILYEHTFCLPFNDEKIVRSTPVHVWHRFTEEERVEVLRRLKDAPYQHGKKARGYPYESADVFGYTTVKWWNRLITLFGEGRRPVWYGF